MKHIGKLVATHGLKGELVMVHGFQAKLNLDGLTAVLFVEQKSGSFIPYFIEGARATTNEEVIVKLEGVDTPEKAKLLVRKPVCVEDEIFEKLTPADSLLMIIGYMVTDKQAGLLGPVAEIIESPGQMLAMVMVQDKEVLIPINETTLKKIDPAAKKVLVDLPDGLLSIYLD